MKAAKVMPLAMVYNMKLSLDIKYKHKQKFHEWSFPSNFMASNVKVNHFYEVIVRPLFKHNSNFIIWNGILLIIRRCSQKVLPREIYHSFLFLAADFFFLRPSGVCFHPISLVRVNIIVRLVALLLPVGLFYIENAFFFFALILLLKIWLVNNYESMYE